MAPSEGAAPSPGSAPSPGAAPSQAPAQGTAPAQPGIGEATLVTAPFTVEDIDRKARKVTVRAPDNDQTTITVPADTKGFDTLKKGDTIDVDYYRSVALSVLPAGAKPTASESLETARGAQGGIQGRTIKASAKIISVDRQDNTVQFKGPDGKEQEVSVSDPAVRRKLENVKPGDVVQVTYTEAVAAEIRPSGKTSR